MGHLRLFYRIPWLLLHVLIGLPLTVLSFSRPGRFIRIAGKPFNEIMLHWFSATTCRIFGLRRRVSGSFTDGPQLVVANHISWLDISLLHSVSAMGFIAKAEIRRWPLIGWIVSVGDTVFHERGSHDSSSGVARVMSDRLESGSRVAVFAEGGILPGFGVKRFHARMFAAAINSSVPVTPVMIRYMRKGEYNKEITFKPGEPFSANFFRLLTQEPCLAELQILPSIDSGGRSRRELAGECEARVRAAFEQFR